MLPAGGGEPTACEAHLTCARETAKRGGGVLDERNVCGAVCSHGVPVRSSFMSSSEHENFGQYVAMLAVLRSTLLPEMEALLLDINCQFSRHVKNNVEQLADGLRFCIGWLHAKAGHNLDCQLEFNAMFAEGLGRCFGEGIEQLWVRASKFLAAPSLRLAYVLSCKAAPWNVGMPISLVDINSWWLYLPLSMQAALKPVARIQRYEALHHRLVTLELALHHFGMGKYSKSWQLLVQVGACSPSVQLIHLYSLCISPHRIPCATDQAAYSQAQATAASGAVRTTRAGKECWLRH